MHQRPGPLRITTLRPPAHPTQTPALSSPPEHHLDELRATEVEHELRVEGQLGAKLEGVGVVLAVVAKSAGVGRGGGMEGG